MKKILMIGKFNTIFQDMNQYLEQYFQMQACVDSHDMVKGMLSLSMPDAVIVSLIGMDKEGEKILRELRYNHSRVPVLCIGTKGEQEMYVDFLRMEQFYSITRPVKNEEILERMKKLLDVNIDAESGVMTDNRNRKKVVLLVDDNAMQLRTLNEMLRGKYEVQMATSGMKALTLIGKKKPDIIFLDYEMPMCDGKMTMEMIREVEEAKDIPIVFLTGVRDKEHIEAVLRLKPAGYLLKPASVDMIFSCIHQILGID